MWTAGWTGSLYTPNIRFSELFTFAIYEKYSQDTDLVRMEGTVFENNVKFVINYCGVVSPTTISSKSDINQCYFVEKFVGI